MVNQKQPPTTQEPGTKQQANPIAEAEELLFSVDENPSKKSDQEISWKASEYIMHEKSTSWYVGLIGIAMVVGVILYLANGGITGFAVLAVMTAAVIVYAARKPDTLLYTLNSQTLTIGDRQYQLDDFRAFSVVQDGGVVTIVLSPLRRFMPPVTLYYDPKDEEAIFNILASVLPHEDSELDFIDRLIRKVRF